MADDPAQKVNPDLTDRELLLMIIAKQGSMDARIQVIEESGIWKAIHDSTGAQLRTAASYEAMVNLVNEALQIVRREGVKADALRELQEDVQRLARRTPPPGSGI